MGKIVQVYRNLFPSNRRPWLRFVVAAGLLFAIGCRSQWYRPTFTQPQSTTNGLTLFQEAPQPHQVFYGSTDLNSPTTEHPLTLAEAEKAYATGDDQLQVDSSACVDSFFVATLQSWRYLQWSTTSCRCDPELARAWQLYHSSLGRLIETSQQFRRLNPFTGLTINTTTGPTQIPVTFHGFAWEPQDFNRLVLVGDYHASELPRKYYQKGIGVPLVAIRCRQCEERFHTKSQRFAATAILRDTYYASDQSGPALQIYAPMNRYNVELGPNRVQLQTDITAPYALLMSTKPRDYVEEFLQPGRSVDEAKLIMLEPYQPGKIPLIFVHGLLSDPLTWATMANEIESNPELSDRYQIWAFRYPTGEPFLRSAATLRQELQAAIDTYDPQHQDPAMSQMVLVGHSMGGLISKLQVTYSGNLVWCSSANRPLDDIVATPEQREELRRLFFFSPQPAIKQVVFIGTPHQGSSTATRLIGRVGSSLVNLGQLRKTEHDLLVENNPDTFSRQLSRRIPTSVDMLEPSNEILQSIQRLPWNPATQLHSIIGTGRPMLLEGPADGIVPVTSARHPGVVSERLIDATHTELARHRQTAQELTCILTKHLAAFDQQ